jgi:nucleoside-diphosphate-sugar epimerase
VFNAGRSGENYRKLDLVEAIKTQIDRGKVSYVHRDEDPRDYKVSFDKIRSQLGFETRMTVPDGIAEIIGALDVGAFGDPFDPRYRNTP